MKMRRKLALSVSCGKADIMGAGAWDLLDSVYGSSNQLATILQREKVKSSIHRCTLEPGVQDAEHLLWS